MPVYYNSLSPSPIVTKVLFDGNWQIGGSALHITLLLHFN
jgi:hypothetical protein